MHMKMNRNTKAEPSSPVCLISSVGTVSYTHLVVVARYKTAKFVLVKIYKTGVAVVLIVIDIVYTAITVGHAFFFHFIEISKAVTL